MWENKFLSLRFSGLSQSWKPFYHFKTRQDSGKKPKFQAHGFCCEMASIGLQSPNIGACLPFWYFVRHFFRTNIMYAPYIPGNEGRRGWTDSKKSASLCHAISQLRWYFQFSFQFPSWLCRTLLLHWHTHTPTYPTKHTHTLTHINAFSHKILHELCLKYK